MRNELKLRKGDDISGPDLIISLSFSCEEIIARWGILSFENLNPEVVKKNEDDIHMHNILSLTLLSNEKVECDKEHE